MCRIASWNINGSGGVRPERRGAIVSALRDSLDVIVLQEVAWKGDLRKDLLKRLSERGWHGVVDCGVGHSKPMRYGNLIASRFPIEKDTTAWAPDVPFRQSLLRAVIQHPKSEFVVIGAHIPNGSKYGWQKIKTLEVLAESLKATVQTRPTLLAGDFNEPRDVLSDGTIIPFGMRKVASGHWSSEGMRTIRGEKHPRRRWADAVRSILGRDSAVRLERAARVTGGSAEWHVTHQVGKQERSFDHILVSPHWTVLETGFDDDVRRERTSDHSLVWAEVQLNG